MGTAASSRMRAGGLERNPTLPQLFDKPIVSNATTHYSRFIFANSRKLRLLSTDGIGYERFPEIRTEGI